ncbi:hypothetical protein B0A61_10695 [Flavobacterium aquatile LMG 4008 = ATCC 11947]|uniref:Uncharacterized protein n=1 Tax=Flavobacterium aquatile LMG 4008 = ATCC 11947 TaxID=1453498 RepID=A0A095SS56_9FLAO|nr:hypothetical protein LG45_13210 [Flavobacterium aquatile LMG 4008 = ATCC 11947]OXA66666.1 hypothetical protein B0A61_10695 [Flavobacterium aquatile LMG 4008 = ATCC 11947]
MFPFGKNTIFLKPQRLKVTKIKFFKVYKLAIIGVINFFGYIFPFDFKYLFLPNLRDFASLWQKI